ncbi:unnamed protein product [Didymodactylos carnosus]|uniref:Retrotransposon gag domain-containing protein n=1 Tax=Didymodactylos carnosus TaxID=1234261 RepID=A0A815FWR3_9BILA|nr:unnamed protein product [Didymodactylos carnosus]CAF4184371.1 unnamed protein product [Didymodactylos carnosus]
MANDRLPRITRTILVHGKLIQNAAKWLDTNESTFTDWSTFENAIKNRYTSLFKKQGKFSTLKGRKQTRGESTIDYYDNVRELCLDIDSAMSEPTMIQHIMSGLDPEIKIESLRVENELKTLKEFEKVLKREQDIVEMKERMKSLLGQQQ